jgi:DNA-directed RNA polymerase subunit RPC12/RpoP
MNDDRLIHWGESAMAGPTHSIECPKCSAKLFREDRVVELNASVVVSRSMHIPAQVNAVTYQYTCIGCGHVLDEQFSGGILKAN